MAAVVVLCLQACAAAAAACLAMHASQINACFNMSQIAHSRLDRRVIERDDVCGLEVWDGVAYGFKVIEHSYPVASAGGYGRHRLCWT